LRQRQPCDRGEWRLCRLGIYDFRIAAQDSNVSIQQRRAEELTDEELAGKLRLASLQLRFQIAVAETCINAVPRPDGPP
jgi:hypothetical protein